MVDIVQNNFLISISTISYNHVDYIRDCIEGFLIQKTNFPIEILIHDDASTDGTEEIIREYEAKYPDIIKVLTTKKNVGAMKNSIRTIKACTGKYIALCEGDDY